MKSHLGLTGRQTAACFIAKAICSDDVKAIPAADRRLAIYRRCLSHITDNITNLQGKLRRARSPAKREHWECALEIWLDLARYFETAIRTNCGGRP